MTAPSLTWAVKHSFVDYVRRFGEIRLSADVVEGPMGFVFPAAPPASVGDEFVLRFKGRVDFTAHAGLLSASVIDPEVTFTGDTGQLTTATLTAIGDVGDRLILAQIDMPPETFDRYPARLSVQGTMFFDFRYPTGEDLAPIVIH